MNTGGDSLSQIEDPVEDQKKVKIFLIISVGI
jgi:hypothetical protein